MQKIIPHLWFDKEAKAAAEFYTSVFDNSKINFINLIPDTPSGDAELVGFQIMGYDFMAISAGPFFKINPSISFHARCRTFEDVDKIWKKLSAGGTVMMELGEYPFSKRYGWIQDKFGVSWQVIHTEGEFRQRILPAFMFVGGVCGKAEEAIGFYTSIFQNTKAEVLARYEKGEAPDNEGTVKYAQFSLDGQEFAAMDSAWQHNFGFNEAVSLIVNCKDQAEIDYFWEKLSAVPEADLPAPPVSASHAGGPPNKFYVYVILCGNDSMYIGQTQDIAKRWREHEAGTAAEHTRKYKPIRLIHYEEFSTREEAVKREKNLKTEFGRKWLKREYKAGRMRQAGQCGWIKDKYGVSWQITPANMEELIAKNPEKTTPVMLKMKKIIIAELEQAGAER